MEKIVAIISATIGVALIICIILLPNGATGQNAVREKEQVFHSDNKTSYENQKKSKKQTVQFSSVSDVYAYLTGNTFVNNNGDRMSFTSDLCVYVNGECLSFALKVVDYKKNGAELRGSTPYGTRLHLAVLPEASCVLDMNDGDRYFIRNRR
ncbi:MAG: hypothetical protein IJS91_05310 [Bacteroidales bacterium]|nr:hypothetical protein [Bacteroidales bacterium]